MENITVEVVLLKRTIMKKESQRRGENIYPVKLRITHDGNQRYYKANAAMSEKEFKKARQAKKRGRDEEHFKQFNRLEEKAHKIIDHWRFSPSQIL